MASEPVDRAVDPTVERAVGPAPGTGAATTVLDPVDPADRVDGADPDDEDTEDPTDPSAQPPGATSLIEPARPDLRECANCGAPNSARRNICGRCGADLRTGVVPEGSGRIAAARSGERRPRSGAAERLDDDHRRTGRIVALVVAVGVLLGALIGGLIALDAGPFGQDDAATEVPEAPPFDAGRYGDDPEALTVTAIGTSTTLEPLGDERYDAAQMVDRDLATAWNNDGARNASGVGEVIAIEFAEPVWVDEIVLANGSQDADAAFLGNARLERARVRFDGGTVFEITFLDRQQLQSVQLPEPVLTTGALVDVLSAFPGDTYEDLAIAELRFVGWVAEDDDRAAAEERAGTAAEE